MFDTVFHLADDINGRCIYLIHRFILITRSITGKFTFIQGTNEFLDEFFRYTITKEFFFDIVLGKL